MCGLACSRTWEVTESRRVVGDCLDILDLMTMDMSIDCGSSVLPNLTYLVRRWTRHKGQVHWVISSSTNLRAYLMGNTFIGFTIKISPHFLDMHFYVAYLVEQISNKYVDRCMDATETRMHFWVSAYVLPPIVEATTFTASRKCRWSDYWIWLLFCRLNLTSWYMCVLEIKRKFNHRDYPQFISISLFVYGVYTLNKISIPKWGIR